MLLSDSARYAAGITLLILQAAFDCNAQTFSQPPPPWVAHSKLPQYNGGQDPLDAGLELAVRMAAQKGLPNRGLIITTHDEVAHGTQDPYAVGTLAALACSAGVVVVGTPVAPESHLSSDRTRIFTDYAFRVSSVLKDSAGGVLEPARTLVLTRVGGHIQTSKGTIEYEDEAMPALAEGGIYLLFLRALPETGAFESINANATFQRKDGHYASARGAFRLSRPNSFGDPPGAFESQVVSNVSACER